MNLHDMVPSDMELSSMVLRRAAELPQWEELDEEEEKRIVGGLIDIDVNLDVEVDVDLK